MLSIVMIFFFHLSLYAVYLGVIYIMNAKTYMASDELHMVSNIYPCNLVHDASECFIDIFSTT